ncbi:HAD family hydrolase [Bosea sp. F3-2]|uniref:HAD family hydrolase n=1 Tax=Bosea sp. F3-2 TaxID=2599640 RepID=UPI0011EFDC65|nr:HAD family hydrolase [Bosea sp. F3-2]QEL23768.1 HAD family hydrolase [Bosea sp. F3-2]
MPGWPHPNEAALLEEVDLVSTDLFDTLLLRTLRSERARIVAGERMFARRLAEQGLPASDDWLVEARLEAQRLAYRALDMTGQDGEVVLRDVIRRQLAILGVPKERMEALCEARLAIELAIEKESLRPNLQLAALLRRCRAEGRRVIAISDIGLPNSILEALVTHVHGPDLLDRIYSSADIGLTKRRGGLFDAVLAAEGIDARRTLHVGDDRLADHAVPSALGLRTLFVPRPKLRRRLSRLHGGASELGRIIRRRPADAPPPAEQVRDPHAFGREVLGPIVAEFCLAIWLYAAEAGKRGDAALLFCARGGLGIRAAFERIAERLSLPLALPRENLMISRLVAARAAVMARSGAALDELGREFHGHSFADVAAALGGQRYQLLQCWDEPFAPDRFFAMLDRSAGEEILADIDRQNTLFRRHLAASSGGAGRIILSDTGLYGSTQRLLAAGLPDLSFETIQLARCNYKGLSEDHFPRVVGLAVERNRYSPFAVRSTVLRYWQLIESLFEPAIPSVRSFAENAGGEVTCNAGDITFGAVDPAIGNPLLAGALAYIDGVRGGTAIMVDAARAWPRLRQAITRPVEADLTALAIGERSVDFGRSGTVGDSGALPGGPLSRLASIRSQLWREGAIVRAFPRSRLPLLTAVEAFHALRGLSAGFHR